MENDLGIMFPCVSHIHWGIIDCLHFLFFSSIEFHLMDVGRISLEAFILYLLLILQICVILEVEPQYSGARIEGDVITLDFVKKMMDDFKNQKCLHKRYVSKHR